LQGCAEAVGERFASVGVDVEEGDFRALIEEVFDEAFADAGCASGYQHCFALQAGVSCEVLFDRCHWVLSLLASLVALVSFALFAGSRFLSGLLALPPRTGATLIDRHENGIQRHQRQNINNDINRKNINPATRDSSTDRAERQQAG
jgi:hypothetical protein